MAIISNIFKNLPWNMINPVTRKGFIVLLRKLKLDKYFNPSPA
ncbi:hypothetical protein [Clostridium botulinum]|nr:hypothetical protein [Clostridium botulinum]